MERQLPILTGPEVVFGFELFGWQTMWLNGSHFVMTKKNELALLLIPDESEISRGMLRTLIRAAGLTAGEFIDTLNV
ncbi:MAG: type II toxin-antitoxin system HicA family toxin [Chlorobium sp.]